MHLPVETVRGAIKDYLRQRAHLLAPCVLEIGSQVAIPGAWWMDNRDLVSHGKWIGIDVEEGQGVDKVMDAHALEFEASCFGSVLCSEVLEHVRRPWQVIEEMHRVLVPDGWALITTLFSFPMHGFPDDYWRFSPHCMWHLMNDAGFRNIEILTAGHYSLELDDHGDGVVSCTLPRHVFACGQK